MTCQKYKEKEIMPLNANLKDQFRRPDMQITDSPKESKITDGEGHLNVKSQRRTPVNKDKHQDTYQ